MADVANSISTSPQVRSNSYVTSPCSSNNALVSPNIVEAIDRIFPKSPSQLLPQSFSDNPNGKKLSSKTAAQSQSSAMSSTLPCTVSMAHLTTDTTTTATAVFTNLTTSSGTKSPLMSSTPNSHMNLPSLPAQTKVSSHRNGTVDVNLANSNNQKKTTPKRISKADLEIMNNLTLDQNSNNGRPLRLSLSEKEMGNSQSHAHEQSDSDDMCRPFVNLKKEKKKKKKRQAKAVEKSKTELDQSSGNTADVSPSPNVSKFSIHQTDAPDHPSGDELCQSNTEPSVILDVPDFADNKNSQLDMSLSNNHNDSGMSNASATDVPTNVSAVSYRKQTERQKLPKTTRRKYHAFKDVKRIQKFFPACFVVLKNIAEIPHERFALGESLAFNLTLKERVKALSSLCVERKIECVARRKTIDDIFNYKNPLDSSHCSNSEDEFRIPQGRSLRKRRQDICYVEPSEDDLLEDVTVSSKRKKSGQSKKDSSVPMDVLPEEGSSVSDDNQSSEDPLAKKKAKLQSPSTVNEEVKEKTTLSASTTKSDKPEVMVFRGMVSKDTKTTQLQLQSKASSTTVTSLVMTVPGTGSVTVQSSSNTTLSGDNNNVVYVYPKKKVLRTTSDFTTKSGNESSKASSAKKSITMKSPRPGPASKTNRPLNITLAAPVSTLSMVTSTKSSNPAAILGLSGNALLPPSLLQNLTLPTTCASLSTSASQRNSSLPSNLCMVKIDGKDYLLSMPGPNNLLAPTGGSMNSTTTSTAIPIPSTNLIPGSSAPRYMLYQPNTSTLPSVQPLALTQSTSLTKETSPTFSIPRLTTAVTVPGRVPSSAIHYLPTSLVPQSSSLTSASLQACMRASTSASVVVSSAQSLASSSSLVTLSNTTVSAIPTVVTSLISSALCLSPAMQTTSSGISSGTRHIRSLVSPLIAPGSSTVIPRHTGQTATTTSSSVVTPNSSVSGARCFRIIVPACTAVGSSARIATLGTSAISSPLTRLSASSSLLPQRKHSLNNEMSPEKRAAKRRRLEKKYPLPPGVVIKTEPLDAPQPPPVVQSGSVRSLLSAQNIQLIAASRSAATGVQRFRIISPNTPGVMVASRSVRLASNVIIRAPVISDSSSRSLSCLSSSLPSASSLNARTSIVTPTSVSAIVTRTIQGSSITTTASSSASGSRGTISLLSPGALLLSSTTVGVSTVTAASNTTNSTSSASPSTVVVSAQSSQMSVPAPTVENGSKGQQPAAKNSGIAADAETLRQAIDKLQKLIAVQEAQGLKGARLDKLKEILSQKKSALLELEQEIEASGNSGADNQADAVTFGTSADDPLVID